MLEQNAIATEALASKGASLPAEARRIGLSPGYLADRALAELELLGDASKMRHSELAIG